MIFFLFSFLICLALPVILKKLLSKSRLCTNKEKPMFLGISIYLSVFLIFMGASIYCSIDLSFLMNILIGASFILLIGIVDDIKNLSVKVKLAGQITAACIVVFLGTRTSIAYFPAWANMIITLIWIVAMVNAFNFLDIMDGLCTGISFIVSVVFLIISIISGIHSASIFFLILSGSTLAALIHNLPHARFYLGDSGSMLIGFIFACSTMHIRYAPDTSQWLSLFVPILIMSLPLYDLIFTVFIRWKKGKAIFKKSSDHFALMLKDRGFSTGRVLTIMYIACIVSGLSAFLLKALPLPFKPWLLTIFIFTAFLWNLSIVKILKAGSGI
jgi:UDP-GlcNAc:undecaprenyl-phosphate/decaprenyl-phosphate GlcNAc-1-phosphate transferase